MATKQLTDANYDSMRTRLYNRIHRTGEEVKNDFPNILRTAIENKAWKHFVDSEGKPFSNLVDWLQYTIPNGVSLGQGQHSLTYKDALKLTEGAPDVHRVLEENAPKDKGGRPSKNGTKTSSSTGRFSRRSSDSAAVLSVRLAQEKSKYYDAYLRGEYNSVTAAAIAAGLLKNNANMRRTKSGFRQMTSGERKEFLQWIEEGAK